MNGLAMYGLTAAGALAGIPTAAVAFSAPAHGRVRLPPRWWYGAPARPVTVFSVSLLTGAAAGVVAVCLPWSLVAPAYWIFAVIGVGLAIIDMRCRRLPHTLTGVLWCSCALGLAAESMASGQVGGLVVGAVIGSSVVVFALLIAFTLPGQLGLGDVSLSGVIAFSLGGINVEAVAVGLLAGVALQAFVALGSKLRTRDRPGPSHLPFGPALLMGWVVALVLSAR